MAPRPAYRREVTSISKVGTSRMTSSNQEQSATEGSTAVQAGGDVTITHVGLSYSEAREMMLHVFQDNFYKLAGIARDTAKARAEEVTEKFLAKLQQENPAGLSKATAPDFQYAVYTVQKEYARSGDRDLGDLLVDLLVDRSKQQQRNILQLVLNESLATAPKLTDDQLAVLAVVFLFRYTKKNDILGDEALGKFFDLYVA